MRIILLLALCHSFARGQNDNRRNRPAAANEKYLTKLQDNYFGDFRCLERLDSILESKWTKDMNKIATEDLGSVEPDWIPEEVAKPMYHTAEQEWLMESGSTSRQIDTCVRGLVSEIVPLLNREEVDCLNKVFTSHIEEEIVHEEIFKDELKREKREQLPFRRFFSFTQFVELMFQSRTPDSLEDSERTLYEHAESFLTTEMDRIDSTYIMEQECEWKNARALREAPNINARLNEFVRQVEDSVNLQVANNVVKEWNLNATLPRDKYSAWLKVRENLTTKINAEVEKLRTQKRDAQWLCERANEFAYQLSVEEVRILIGRDSSRVDLGVSEVSSKAKGIAKAMEKIGDFRHPVFKMLAKKYEYGAKCFSAFLHLVQHHRKFDIALAFVNGEYNYPQFYCKRWSRNLGLIATRFCKCIGSFCVTHGLAVLLAGKYDLQRGPDGIYRVVPTGKTNMEIFDSFTRN